MSAGRHRYRAALGGAFVLALVLRLRQQQPGLLYPDGYEYLLMARGIAEHLRPTTLLGPAGDLFVPNPDAAAKPLYPALVAGVHLFGISWLTAARVVSASSSAAAVVLTGLLAARLGRSKVAGFVAGLLMLTAPGVVYWAGFLGPDQLGLAPGLASALALVRGRNTTGGVLAGLACCARPEAALVASAAAVAAFARPWARAACLRAAVAALATVGAVLVLLRPPLQGPDRILLAVVPLALVPAALAAVASARVRTAGAVALLAGTVAAAFAGALPGLSGLWAGNWPILALGACGFVVAALAGRPDAGSAALTTVLLGGVLVAVYAVKNPHQERYFALLLPLAALGAGLGVAGAARDSRRVAVIAASAVVLALTLPAPAGRSQDMFPVLAGAVASAVPPQVPLVTAAGDAYGFLLPDRSVRSLRPGARGAIVLDAAQRAFAPGLAVRGRLVARIPAGQTAFVGPGGEIDPGGATLVVGTVTRLGASHALAAAQRPAA